MSMVITLIRLLTAEGDGGMIHTPAYPPFAKVIQLNNRKLVRQSLVETNCRFEIDFADFSIVLSSSTKVAFETGKDWLAELKQVLEESIETGIAYQEEHTQIRAMKPEGTYLIWLDFSAYDMSHEEIQRKLLEEARVQLNDGLVFGKEGRYKARFNIAAPLAVVKEACERIARVFGKAE